MQPAPESPFLKKTGWTRSRVGLTEGIVVAQALPKRAVSKSKFSMYLRTLCDRELYLSLFSNNPAQLSAAGIPVPVKLSLAAR
jgi:hypothetical protein